MSIDIRNIGIVYITVVLWLVVVVVTATTFYLSFENLHNLYQSKLQVAMFAGFLTIGGFLLTLKSFVVIQFKKELFEKEYYRSAHKASHGTYSGKTYYRPLKDLAELLLVSVVLSLITSFIQITIGFLNSNSISAICIGSGIATLFLVVFLWYFVRWNILEMFKWWEKDIDSLNSDKN